MSRVIIDIVPRPAFRDFLNRKERFACVVAHRRAGKTFACVQDLIRAAMGYKRPGPPCRYGYIAPTRDQAKDITWKYLTEYSSPIPGVKINQSELSIVYPGGSTIRLYSGDSYDRMRGLYFDGVVVDEPADIDPNAWTYVILPCLSDYQGWATFIGTCKGKNAFWKTFRSAVNDPNWHAMTLKASESGILPASELKILRDNMSDEAYRQEYECDWSVGVPGSLFASYIDKAHAEGRICNFISDATAPVHTLWDIGLPMNTVCWLVQIKPEAIYVIDCIREMDIEFPDRVALLNAKGHRYGLHLFPHDAGVRQSSGFSQMQEFQKFLGNGCRVVPATPTTMHAVGMLQGLFKRLIFHATNCAEALEWLGCYRAVRESSSGIAKLEPVHDKYSHGATALYGLPLAIEARMIPNSHIIGAAAEPEQPQRRAILAGARR